MAAQINLVGNGFSLSGLKGGFLVALYQMTSETGRWTPGLIDTGFFDSDGCDILLAVCVSSISSLFSACESNEGGQLESSFFERTAQVLFSSTLRGIW